MRQKPTRYYKAVTLSLKEADYELLEAAVAQISFARNRTLPLSHFLRFLIQTYSEDAKQKFIEEKINLNP